MKYQSFSAALLIVLTSCSHESPKYESQYVTPATTTIAPVSSSPRPMTPQLTSQASFADNFDRPDTTAGLGEGWDMRGDYDKSSYGQSSPIMPSATDGFIKDGHYTYAGASSVFAARQFRGTVLGVGTIGRFRDVGAGHEAAFAMAISANNQLVFDMVILSATPLGWQLRLRRDRGDYQPVMSGSFSPKLDLNTNYQFEFDVVGNTITVRVPGAEVTRDARVASLLGDRAFWQEAIAGPPASVVFDFDTVWAIEDGQQLFPIG